MVKPVQERRHFFNLFFGEIKPDKGKILLDNIPLHKEKKLSDKVAFLFQNPENNLFSLDP